MKILMMTNTYAPIVGGLEKSIDVFSEAFRKMGHTVKIIAPDFEAAEESEHVVRVPALPNVHGTKFSIALPTPEFVANFIKEYQPDIIHAHHPFLVGDMALRIAGQYRIPLVFTYHTMFEQYTDYFGLDMEAVQAFVIKLASGFSNLCDHVIVPSESIKKILIDRKVKTPIAVVPTGVDVENFKNGNRDRLRNKFNLQEDTYVIGNLGRISSEKNLLFLGSAVSQYLAENQKAHFLVVGSGPAEEKFKDLFSERGVSDRLHLAGVLTGRDLVDAYYAMDVFAFASKSETQGMVVTEAMASGLGVIALDAPGVREVVKDKENGRLLAKESRDDFVDALKWHFEISETEKQKIKEKALRTAGDFSMDNSSKEALRIYKVTRFIQEYSEQRWNNWSNILDRLKTEWDMLKNIGEAAGGVIISQAFDRKIFRGKILDLFDDRYEDFLKKIKKEKAEQKDSTEARDVQMKVVEMRSELENLLESIESYFKVEEEKLTKNHKDVKSL
jgi:1,2-diacylglycerol 3-alpha-glucosyltransferase